MPERMSLNDQNQKGLNHQKEFSPDEENGKNEHNTNLYQTPPLGRKIDIYEEDGEFSRHLEEYTDAIKRGNSTKLKELEDWFTKHHPDI